MNHNKIALLLSSALIITASVSAQAVSGDSISMLKQQKSALIIGKRINDNKLKLAKLENTVGKETQDMQNAGEVAQKSADNNGQTANKLTEDAQNKKLAADASKSAKEAKYDAKKAREANASLENLKKEIESLKMKIAEDESKLSAMSPNKSNN